MTILDWQERVGEAGKNGLRRLRTATAAERAAVAAALAVPGCDKLEVRYEITPLARRRYRVSGSIAAVLQRTCVVELEDFPEAIDETFDIEFWPADQHDAEDGAARGADGSLEIAVDALSGDDPEAIVNGRIDVGGVTYQVLATALDPFPRKPNAELDVTEAGASGPDEKENPFAVLRQLKRGDDNGPAGGGAP